MIVEKVKREKRGKYCICDIDINGEKGGGVAKSLGHKLWHHQCIQGLLKQVKLSLWKCTNERELKGKESWVESEVPFYSYFYNSFQCLF